MFDRRPRTDCPPDRIIRARDEDLQTFEPLRIAFVLVAVILGLVAVVL